MNNKNSAQCTARSAQYPVRSTCAVRGVWWWRRYTAYCALFTVYCVLLTACAQIVTPDGGPKDVIPPRVVKYSPDSAATNFQEQKIVITFDEYITLNDLNKQLIISPAVKRRPEVTIHKKDLVVEFREPLEANTTYSISFGTAIRDITEGNVLSNFRFVFSTGPFIDSLQMRGTIVNAQTLRGEKNVLVMLYRDTRDSVVFRQKPYYYTRTDEAGNFTLTNLATAEYKIFALEDQGEDYLYNSPEERIAFQDSLINLTVNMDSIRLLMFREKSVKQFLVKSDQLAPGRFRFVYNLPVSELSLGYAAPLPEKMNVHTEISATKDTLNVWISSIETDSVTFVLRSGSTVLDSVPMKLTKPGQKKNVRAGTIDPRAFILSNNAAGGKLAPGSALTLFASGPVRSIDSSKIFLTQGKDTLPLNLRLAPGKRELRFAHQFPEDSTYRLFLAPGGLTDWYGQKNDTLVLSFTTQSSRSFGNLSVKMPNLESGKYLVEIVDDKDRVVRDTLINGPATVEFDGMNAGNYRVRLVHDTDGDGRFTTGNYLAGKHAEKVIYYTASIRVRAGWDMDIEWILQ